MMGSGNGSGMTGPAGARLLVVGVLMIGGWQPSALGWSSACPQPGGWVAARRIRGRS